MIYYVPGSGDSYQCSRKCWRRQTCICRPCLLLQLSKHQVKGWYLLGLRTISPRFIFFNLKLLIPLQGSSTQGQNMKLATINVLQAMCHIFIWWHLLSTLNDCKQSPQQFLHESVWSKSSINERLGVYMYRIVGCKATIDEVKFSRESSWWCVREMVGREIIWCCGCANADIC